MWTIIVLQGLHLKFNEGAKVTIDLVVTHFKMRERIGFSMASIYLTLTGSTYECKAIMLATLELQFWKVPGLMVYYRPVHIWPWRKLNTLPSSGSASCEH